MHTPVGNKKKSYQITIPNYKQWRKYDHFGFNGECKLGDFKKDEKDLSCLIITK